VSDQTPPRRNIGDLQPSQILYSFGVGAIVELPNLSVMMMGLDDWPVHHCREVNEPRLLYAVQEELGPQVSRLLSPPVPPDADGGPPKPLGESASVGVPVAPFPRWLLCPRCRLIAPIGSDLFELKVELFKKDRTRYVHRNCNRAVSASRPPTAVPARFLVACKCGHLDEFPWLEFVHRGEAPRNHELRLYELGASGEVADIEAKCVTCGAVRRMADAFTGTGKSELPACRGRWPHLRKYAEDGCGEPSTGILLGASNSWFPLTLSALSIPTASDPLGQLVEANWAKLEKVTSSEVLAAFRQIGTLAAFAAYSDEDVWQAVEAKRGVGQAPADQEPEGLRDPEWRAFSEPGSVPNSRDFELREVPPPPRFEPLIERVVLVERLREVRSLIGFTRIESPGDMSEPDELPAERRAPLSRGEPRWVPTIDVRGEGIFIQLSESAVEAWVRTVGDLDDEFVRAHRAWRKLRKVEPPDAGYPGMRYVLLHSLAHSLMRQLTLQCGYTAASVRERIYSRDPSEDREAMAGLLIYTAASDSEGTLGGLVSLGEPSVLATHLHQALEEITLCASDPLCAEHPPSRDALTLHGAACHACLFAPETSCERGNKYLDRSVLVRTVERARFAFFGDER
jgi:hypothetical protein